MSRLRCEQCVSFLGICSKSKTGAARFARYSRLYWRRSHKTDGNCSSKIYTCQEKWTPDMRTYGNGTAKMPGDCDRAE